MPRYLQAEHIIRSVWFRPNTIAAGQQLICRTMLEHILPILLTITVATAHNHALASDSTVGHNQETQAVKTRAVELLGKLKHLEQQLLYPAYTRITVFVSLKPDSTHIPESVELDIDDTSTTRYLYSRNEIRALRAGGIHRLYIGNIPQGEHKLSFTLNSIAKDGSRLKYETEYAINKSVHEKLVEIRLGDNHSQQQPLVTWSSY